MQTQPIPQMSANPRYKKYTARVPQPARTLGPIVRFALPFLYGAPAHHLDLQRYHLQAWFVVLWPRHFLSADWTFRNPFANPKPSLRPLLFPCNESFHEARVAEYVA